MIWNEGSLESIFEKVGEENGMRRNSIIRTVNSLLRYYYNAKTRQNSFNKETIMNLTKYEAKSIKGITVPGKSWELIEKVKVVLREESFMTVFLSHKMNGLTDDEVFEIRDNAVKYLEEKYGRVVHVIDNFHHDNVPEDAGRIWHLGESIKMMEKADGIYFCPGWMDAKGCQIEYKVCRTYGLKILD